MTYLAFGFDDCDEATVGMFCSTAAELGYEEVRRWPICGGCVILCVAVSPRNKSAGLDLYDTLCHLVERGKFPLWVSLLYPSEVEWEAGETLSLEAK
jgi:hypothetical protein